MWEVIGHQWAIDLLQSGICLGKIAQSNLFTGPEGIGKTHLALWYAAALLCDSESAPCGHCRACRLVAEHKHPDVVLIDGGQERIGIGQMRELQHDLALSPVMGRYRLVILSSFDNATREAANAFLKTLEDPLPHAVIVVTSVAGGLLLPTIVSRCRVLALRPLPVSLVARALQETHGLPQERAELLARISGGCVGWAISALGDEDRLRKRSDDLDRVYGLISSNRAERLDAAETLAKRPDLSEVLGIWQGWWRDIALLASGSLDLVVNADRLAELTQASERFGFRGAIRAVQAIAETQDRLNKNVNARMAIEVLLLDWEPDRAEVKA